MIHAASFNAKKGQGTRGSSTGVKIFPSRWTHCWGVFEGNAHEYNKDDPRVVMTINSSPAALPIQKAFIESKWFRELIGDDSIKVCGVGLKAAVEAHNHPLYNLKAFNDAGFSEQGGKDVLTIEGTLETPADRFISAMRLLTAFTKSDMTLPTDYPEELLWTWPLVNQFMMANGHAHSDNFCTFFPITAGWVRTYCDDRTIDLDDIDLEDCVGDLNDQAVATEGALLEILGRTEKEFSFLSEQTDPIANGYSKDDHRMVDTGIPEDGVLSVMAPVMAQPSGEVLLRKNIVTLLTKHLK